MEQGKSSAADVLAKHLLQGTKSRPKLGDSVNIRVLQDRAILYALSPGTVDLSYFAGRELGSAYARRAGVSAKGLSDALRFYGESIERYGIGKVEVVKQNGEKAVVRMDECATAWNLPNLGLKVCAFDAGGQAGLLAQLLGKRVMSTEVKCCANGDKYCEFEIRVLATPESAFAEAFKA